MVGIFYIIGDGKEGARMTENTASFSLGMNAVSF